MTAGPKTSGRRSRLAEITQRQARLDLPIYSTMRGTKLFIGIEDDAGAYEVSANLISLEKGAVVTDGHAPAGLSVNFDCSDECELRLPRLLRELLPCGNSTVLLSEEDVSKVVASWIMALVADVPTKPILLLSGPPGSGKTSAARTLMRLLQGPSADVRPLPRSVGDLQLIASKARFVALDNVDARASGSLQDTFAAIATGAVEERRRLYTDEQTFQIRLNCGLILTSMDIPFNRSDVMDRAIPLELTRIASFASEDQIQKTTERFRVAFWASLLHDMQHLLPLVEARDGNVADFRMADFGLWCGVVFGDRAVEVLSALSQAQADAAIRDDDIIPALAVLVQEHPLVGSASKILDSLGETSRADQPETRSPKAFGDYLRRMSSAASKVGLDIRWQLNTHTKTNDFTIRGAASDDRE